MQFHSGHWFVSTVAVLISAFVLAWAGNPQNPSARETQLRDTVPSNKDRNAGRAGDKDLDKELRQLNEARKQLDELKDKDWNKINREVEEAMKKVDVEKIRIQAEEALKEIDMEKIGKEIEEAIGKIDFKKIEQDVEAAMNEVSRIDREKVRQEIQRAGKEVHQLLEKKEWRRELDESKKINMDEVNREMENIKKEMARVKDELKLDKLNMKGTMDKARGELEKATTELKDLQNMIYSMEQDGLLNTKEDYTIEYNQGELSINGNKQSSEVSNKYKKYFKKDKTTIKKRNGNINIDNND